ncbi:MAG: carboxypeptidase-like regulatory domain-containing protein, partial [Bacteroidia bacterium]|nr:carboxypeptidase-like regulatory domain-containing protein [Bacteroidia bacterium]
MNFTLKIDFLFKLFFTFLLLFILGSNVKVWAQPNWKLHVFGKISENGKGLDNASIKISKRGAAPVTINTSSNGKYSFDLDPNGVYDIYITKSGGYITKIVNIDTKNVPAIEDERVKPFTFEMDVDIFKEFKGFDGTLLKDPIGKVNYVASAQIFKHDAEYTKSIQSRLYQLQLEQEKLLKAEAEAAKEAAKKKAEFDAAIKKGDDALNAKKFDNALSAYNDALATQVDNATANAKISSVAKAKADEEARLKAEADAKAKAEADAAAAKEAAKKKAEFDAAIKKGDEALNAKKFDNALSAYNDAL